jgi:hypothetical protein
MQAQGWVTQVATAGNLGEVLAVTKSYLSTWPERQLTQLPAGCLPPKLERPEDITRYAFVLAITALQPPVKPSSETALNCMSTFFSYAASRVSQLKPRH